MLPIAGAVGLALLALIGLALALRRRKLRREEEFAATEQPAYEEPAQVDPLFAETAAEPIAVELQPTPELRDPAIVAPAAPAAAIAPATSPSDCADAAPGSHVEAACEGPTEDNPSLSIKKRLKRAHFFDQREQLAAAGMAVPVEADAGLPDALVDPAAPEAEASRKPV